MDKAIEIPMNDCGLQINVGRDGTWLHFTSSNGQYASINVNSMESRGSIVASAIRGWCEDRQKQAAQIAADNGQFGVGA